MRRGHGSLPVLSEVPHELRTAAHSKESKRSPQQFIPAGFPPSRHPPTGDGKRVIRAEARFGFCSQPSRVLAGCEQKQACLCPLRYRRPA
ncbi:hypothetical protein CRH03_03055 [Clostridium sp. HMb25]|nr:hypothetical protein CRH03_03055 [Clostridium sp. HMb25]